MRGLSWSRMRSLACDVLNRSYFVSSWLRISTKSNSGIRTSTGRGVNEGSSRGWTEQRLIFVWAGVRCPWTGCPWTVSGFLDTARLLNGILWFVMNDYILPSGMNWNTRLYQYTKFWFYNRRTQFKILIFNQIKTRIGNSLPQFAENNRSEIVIQSKVVAQRLHIMWLLF